MDTTRELDDLLNADQLNETRVALQRQAEMMLEMLMSFEARLEERLSVAEARIAALRAAHHHYADRASAFGSVRPADTAGP